MRNLLKVGTAAFLTAFLIPASAHALSINIDFERIEPSNAPENVANQLGLTILDWDQANDEYGSVIGFDMTSDQVLFLFTNEVGIASNIAEIYMDDGEIIDISQVLNSLGGFTDFTGETVTPGNLPGGQNVSPSFEAIEAFSADTANGPPSKGINTADDILGIIYNVKVDFDGVAAALDSGVLRIGLHVRSIGEDGESDAFVNTPPSIPDASSMLLLGSACLIGLGGLRRKHKK